MKMIENKRGKNINDIDRICAISKVLQEKQSMQSMRSRPTVRKRKNFNSGIQKKINLK